MSVSIEVWGDYACFTRPEMKVERVSYDMMTPSAARGILEAVFWHPGMHWVIDSIRVCTPIRFTNIRRNEVKNKADCSKILAEMNGKSKEPLQLVTSENISQRAAMVLKDVRYIITAHFEMTPAAAPSDNPAKFTDMARRRFEKGQYWHQPYFGTREFPVHFRPCTKMPSCPTELEGEKDLGWMLLDMDYSDKADIRPIFFRAVLRDGLLTVPQPDSGEVIVG